MDLQSETKPRSWTQVSRLEINLPIANNTLATASQIFTFVTSYLFFLK